MIRRYGTGADSGFTLVEILVALAIAGIAFSLAFQTFSGVSLLADQDQQLEQAVTIARNEMARVGQDIPLANGTVHGTTPDGYLWQIDIADWKETDPAPFNRETLKRVATTVVWSAGRHRREAHLVTLNLAPRT